MSLRILVVEDVRDTATSMALLLELWGYESTVVYEGKHALAMVASVRPEVVFLDIGLPDVDGCEVARQLRRMPETKRSLLIAITGYGMEANILRCKKAGIDFHFVKPAEPDEIKRVVETAALAASGAVSTS